MTPDNELISNATRPSASRTTKKNQTRQRVSAVLAGLAVVGISAAMMAPSGVAVAEPEPTDSPVTAFSLASADTQSITVSVEGAEIATADRSAFEVYVKPKPTPPPAPVEKAKTAKAAAAPRSSTPAQPRYTGGGSKEEWMAAAGIASSDWPYVDYIVSKESGWNPNATNKSSGACGLVQALPCSKVPGNGYDPVDNLRWGNGYAVGRYGSWAGAYNFWTRNHWW